MWVWLGGFATLGFAVGGGFMCLYAYAGLVGLLV